MSDQLSYASPPPPPPSAATAPAAPAPAGTALILAFPEFQAQMTQLGVLRRCSANHPGDLAFICDGGVCRCLVCGRGG